ncbi:MAG: hypothetical protein IKH22_10300 [Prevotella sp.]|nr:hypothetical protein [Prevotella sp.]
MESFNKTNGIVEQNQWNCQTKPMDLFLSSASLLFPICQSIDRKLQKSIRSSGRPDFPIPPISWAQHSCSFMHIRVAPQANKETYLSHWPCCWP